MRPIKALYWSHMVIVGPIWTLCGHADRVKVTDEQQIGEVLTSLFVQHDQSANSGILAL